MRRMIGWMVMSLALMFCGTVDAMASPAEVEAERANFGFLVSELRLFGVDGQGEMIIQNRNGRFWSKNVEVEAYRLETKLNPLLIEAAYTVWEGRDSFVLQRNIRMDGEYSVPIIPSRGLSKAVKLPLGEGEDMSFYYTLSVKDIEEEYENWPWLGTRIVDYRSCAKDAHYQPGVVCKLREEINGVLYYNAYIDNVLVDERYWADKNDGAGENEGGRGGDDMNGGAVGGVDGDVGGEDNNASGANKGGSGGGASENKNVATSSVVKNNIKDVATKIGTSIAGDVAVAVGAGDDAVVGDDGMVLRKTVRFGWSWLLWIVVGIVFVWLAIIAWKRRKNDRRKTKRGKIVRSA